MSQGLFIQGGSPQSFKNYIINGNFDFWQRGTSFSSSGYGPDRWYCLVGAPSVTFSRVATDLPIGSSYAAKWTATDAPDSWGQFHHCLEAATLIPLRNKTMTVSALIKVAGSFVGDFTIDLKYNNATDSRTAQTTMIGSATALTPTTGWVKYERTFIVPSDAVGLFIAFAPTAGNQPNGAEFYISQVMLNEGPVAAPFQLAGGSIGGELALCQRYYEKSFNVDVTPANSDSLVDTNRVLGLIFYVDLWAFTSGTVPFKVVKRDAPNMTFYGATSGLVGYYNGSVWVEWSSSYSEFTTLEGFRFAMHNGSSSGLPVGTVRLIRFNWVADAEL